MIYNIKILFIKIYKIVLMNEIESLTETEILIFQELINPLPGSWSYMTNLITLILGVLKDHVKKYARERVNFFMLDAYSLKLNYLLRKQDIILIQLTS